MGSMSEGHTKEPIEVDTTHSNRLTRGRLSPYPMSHGRVRGAPYATPTSGQSIKHPICLSHETDFVANICNGSGIILLIARIGVVKCYKETTRKRGRF